VLDDGPFVFLLGLLLFRLFVFFLALSSSLLLLSIQSSGHS
jgi:hypothetical protein